MSNFSRTDSITEDRQGMMLDLNYFLVLDKQRTYLCPHHYEFSNHTGVGRWYWFWQLESGEVASITLP